MMKNKWLILFLVFLFSFTDVSALAVYDQIQIKIPIEVNGKTVVEVSNINTGDNTLLHVNGRDELIFTYDEPGSYVYAVKQAGCNDNFLLDDTEYHLNIEVFCDEQDTLDGVISLSCSGIMAKPAAIEFRNNVMIPATGDIHDSWLYLCLMFCSLAGIACIWKGVGKNEKDHYDDSMSDPADSAD